MTSVVDASDLRVGAVLGRGGQALVVSAATPEGATFAFKRYHNSTVRDAGNTHRKIASMLEHPPDDPTASYGHTSIAWPRYLVLEDGDFVGFLMDTLGEPHLTIPDVRDEAGRSAANVSFGWGELVTCARNLCSAVAALHDVGAAWGDLNEGNVAIYPDGLVTLLDIDACAWRSNDGCFDSAGLGVEEFMPPERFRDGRSVTSEGDCWALAVAVHLILMEGFHPFSFVPPDLDKSPTMEERTLAGMAPLLNHELTPPPLAPRVDLLPEAASAAFRRTFGLGRSEPTARTTALEWVAVLDAMKADLVTCSEGHDHSGHLEGCPWCDLAERRRKRRTGNQVRLGTDERADLAIGSPTDTAPAEKATNVGATRSTPARATPTRWRWLSLAMVACSVALVAAVALASDEFELRSFIFPTVAIAFLSIFHAENGAGRRPGPFQLAALLAAGALVIDWIPPDAIRGDRIAVAAVVPILGHLLDLGIATIASILARVIRNRRGTRRDSARSARSAAVRDRSIAD